MDIRFTQMLFWGVLPLFFFSGVLGCTSTKVGTAPLVKKETQNSDKSSDKSSENEKQRRLLKEEISVGREMAGKLFGIFEDYDSNEKLIFYINQVGQYLSSQIGRPELTYYFSVLNSDEINAFATPGGYILLTKGLLKKIKTESELACVIAHEIAHVNLKHMYKEIVPEREVSTGESLTRLLSGGKADIGSSLSKAISAGMKKLLEEGLLPEKEFEADQTAVAYLVQSGYNPWDFDRLMEQMEGETHKLHVGKTHPPFSERRLRIKKIFTENAIVDKTKVNTEILEKRFKENFKNI